MTVTTLASDRAVKLPTPDVALTGVIDAEAEASGSGAGLFGALMAQLATPDGEAEGSTGEDSGDGADAADGGKTVEVSAGASAPPVATIPAGLASVVMANFVDGADTVAPEAAPPEAKSDVVALAQMIAQSADGDRGDVASPSDDGTAMPGIKAMLQTWVEGPYAAAAPTTGAPDKRPMNLAVVSVATHFAPVREGEVLTPQQPDVIAAPMPETVIRPDSLRAPVATTTATTPATAAPAEAVATVAASNDGQTAPGDGEPLPDDGGRPASHESGAAQATSKGSETKAVETVTSAVQPSHSSASPSKQIAGEIERALPARPQQDVAAGQRHGLSKLKVLQIQLQPESLGTVTVRMELKADVLELKIDAARAETADLIQRDRDVLSSLIRSSGYTVDDAHIRVTFNDPTMQVSPLSTTDSASNGANGGSQSAGERAGERRDGGERRGAQRESDHPDQAETSATRHDGHGIYV